MRLLPAFLPALLPALLACLPWLLPPAGLAAETSPPPIKLYGRAEAIACLNDRDALQQEQQALEARLAASNKRVDAMQLEQDALIAEGDKVDTGNEAAVDAYNQRLKALHARIDQINADVEALNRLRLPLNDKASAHNDRCGTVTMDLFTMEAVKRERAGPPPSAADVRANRSCNEMSAAFVTGQTERYVALVYPPLVRQLGKAAVMAAARRTLDLNAPPGFRVTGMDCAMPVQSSDAGGLQLRLLPVILTADTGEGVLKMESSYLGISGDEGQSWTFVALGRDPSMLKTVLPKGLGSITPPVARRPVIYPRQAL